MRVCIRKKEVRNTKPFWKDRNVLVTGCTGFLGSWLSCALINAEANVIGFVRSKGEHSHLFRTGCQKNMHLVCGSIEDFQIVERTLREYEVDTIFHLAAQSIVDKASQNPLTTYEINIRGTGNVLEAARYNPKVKNIIVASTDRVYGECGSHSCEESAPLKGIHPYDLSKCCADQLCSSYFYSHNLPVAVARCSNLFGGGDLNYNRLIPGTIHSILQGDPPVIRSDGSHIRQYLYVEDCVEAFLLLAERMEELRLYGEAFNLSLESPVSVRQLVQQILDLMDADLKPVVLNHASIEIKRLLISTEKADKVLGWKPKYSLDRGLRKTIEWYRAPENRRLV